VQIQNDNGKNDNGKREVLLVVRCRLCSPKGTPSFRVESPRQLPDAWWDHMLASHPLTCERVRLRFPGYLNGFLAFHSDRRVVAHLASCGICAATLRMMERHMVRKEFGPTARGSARSNGAVVAAGEWV